ncbi:hypothetical protein KM043_009666 [Ampulex compressa]|nr:hypothetical protein KM043_009666 [Ampulex compressa]
MKFPPLLDVRASADWSAPGESPVPARRRHCGAINNVILRPLARTTTTIKAGAPPPPGSQHPHERPRPPTRPPSTSPTASPFELVLSSSRIMPQIRNCLLSTRAAAILLRFFFRFSNYGGIISAEGKRDSSALNNGFWFGAWEDMGRVR